ncbi:hypothetical protein [Acinetobacter gyllenbergii]|uniref:hypothetical protein n=1 Tax=Acinetobacter gyllenbergii TaxID=134534 RepID=UPI000806B40C|nr:hypothetical protein [Acinetobacter gyllenbergii]OBY75535.1 hypothetical protein NG55_02340 [Acinetobacter gyllenbergii]
MSLDELVQRSIKNLAKKHIFYDKSRNLDIIIVKIYPRIGLGCGGQIKLDCWIGKYISIIAEDYLGNYIIRHSSGAVSYLDLEKNHIFFK